MWMKMERIMSMLKDSTIPTNTFGARNSLISKRLAHILTSGILGDFGLHEDHGYACCYQL